MPVANRKQADEIIALVHALESGGRTGIDLSLLAARLCVPTSHLESLLHKNSEYFVRVGSGHKYALNRFAQFGGSAELIVADVERSYRKSRNLLYLVLALCAMSIALLGTAV